MEVEVKCKLDRVKDCYLELPMTLEGIKIFLKWDLGKRLKFISEKGYLKFYEFEFVECEVLSEMRDVVDDYPLHAYPYIAVVHLNSHFSLEIERARLIHRGADSFELLLNLGYLNVGVFRLEDYHFVGIEVLDRSNYEQD